MRLLVRIAAVVALLLPLLLLGCKRRAKKTASAQPPGSIIYAGDPQAASHFIKGFYQIEANSWRWTGKEFAVSLAPPLHAAQNGALLMVHLTVPEPIIENLHATTLSASIEGLSLGSELYAKPGKYIYLRSVPGDRLQGKAVRVEFAVDRTLPPSQTDARELGIVISDVGLVAK